MSTARTPKRLRRYLGKHLIYSAHKATAVGCTHIDRPPQSAWRLRNADLILPPPKPE